MKCPKCGSPFVFQNGSLAHQDESGDGEVQFGCQNKECGCFFGAFFRFTGETHVIIDKRSVPRRKEGKEVKTKRRKRINSGTNRRLVDETL